jgi:excisionase family DNA binding protein
MPEPLSGAQLALVTSGLRPGQLLKTKEVCLLLGIGDDKLRDLVDEGLFGAPRLYPGKVLRYTAEDVWAYKLNAGPDPRTAARALLPARQEGAKVHETGQS